MTDINESTSAASESSSSSSTLPYLQFAAILLNGLEKLAEIQRSALAIYADIAHNTAESVKPVFSFSPAPLFEMAEQAIREFLQIQVRLLDLMLSQTSADKESVEKSSNRDFEAEVARLMLDSTDCLVNMQKKAVEFITQQNRAFAAEIMEQAGSGSESPHDASAIIQAQKKFWDVTLKPFKAWKNEMATAAASMQGAVMPK